MRYDEGSAHLMYLSLGYNKTLDQFRYSDGDIGDIMKDCLASLNFMGVTGTVRFDETGEPLQNIRIQQVQGKLGAPDKSLHTDKL